LWHTPAYKSGDATNSNQSIPALQAINGHARRWLAGDYRADNRAFEILLSEVAAGDGVALLPTVAALEELLSSVLPPDYRDWSSERNARLAELGIIIDSPELASYAADVVYAAARCRSGASCSACAGTGACQ
jgi:DNA-binding transcriptional LysR family regulator